MKTVWKYRLPIQDDIVLEMPFGAELLHVENQGDDQAGYLWALVDSDNGREKRRFKLRGTGHDARDCGAHVGSFMLFGGILVYHLFTEEVGP